MKDSRPSIFWRWFIGTAFVLIVLLPVHFYKVLQPPRSLDLERERGCVIVGEEMPRHCPRCLSEKYLGFDYCRHCGSQLRVDEVQVQKDDRPQTTDRYCGDCGKSVDECKCKT